jgi:transcriptional regulator GlxA family with amidase domain
MKKLLSVLCIILMVACQAPQETQQVAQTTKEVFKPGNKPAKELNVAFLAINGVYNSELMAPFDIFQHTIFHTEKGMKPFIVSPTKEVITTFEGIRILPDYDFDDVPNIDILVVPSAENNMGSDLEDERLINFV